jgi:hypothetical protein
VPAIMTQTPYEAPLELMQFALRQAAETTGAIAIDGYAEVLADLAAPVLESATRFAREVLSPLNTPDAPAGLKGISLFLVPKRIRSPDGTLQNNDIQALSVEHKMGIRASPTCAGPVTAARIGDL